MNLCSVLLKPNLTTIKGTTTTTRATTTKTSRAEKEHGPEPEKSRPAKQNPKIHLSQ